MRIKFLLGFFACGLCLAQYDPALRLGPFHNLQKAGSIEVLVEFPKNATAKASEFHLFEDGKSTSSGATVTQFRNSNWKVALVLAVDVSLSIKPPVFDEIRKACIEFASQSKRTGRAHSLRRYCGSPCSPGRAAGKTRRRSVSTEARRPPHAAVSRA